MCNSAGESFNRPAFLSHHLLQVQGDSWNWEEETSLSFLLRRCWPQRCRCHHQSQMNIEHIQIWNINVSSSVLRALRWLHHGAPVHLQWTQLNGAGHEKLKCRSHIIQISFKKTSLMFISFTRTVNFLKAGFLFLPLTVKWQKFESYLDYNPTNISVGPII